MKKIVIIIISLFLLFSAVNFGTSKPILNNDSTSETDYSIDNSIINNPQEHQILQNINRLDGYFTENRGQVGNDSVRYFIQDKGVWFLDDGVVFEIKEPVEQTEIRRDPLDRFNPEFEPKASKPRKSVVLKLNFVGCNEVEPKGVGLLPHRSNFFYGNDSSKWCTNVPNYREIIYENIYNDIDLRYYSSQKGLKYDFIGRPGCKLEDIKLSYEGVESLYIDTNGNMIITTQIGDIIDSNLFIYQNCDRNEIEGSFIIIDTNTYGFKLSSQYNEKEVVIIDPLMYSTFIGGDSYDVGKDIAIDSQGCAYVTGDTLSKNFPITPNVYDSSHNGDDSDLSVLKLNQNGSKLIYATYIGGGDIDHNHGIALDFNNNVYGTGYTSSSDFPFTPGANDTTFEGIHDAFIFKINQTGALLVYSTFVGGSSNDEGYGIVVDSIGNAHITGTTKSTDFKVTSNAINSTYKGGIYDAYVLKLDQTGSTILYSTFIGGSQGDYGSDIVIDDNGNMYVSGSTLSPNFPTTPGAFDTIFSGGFDSDGFILKISQSGSTLLYSTFVGGSISDVCYSITVDSNGYAYIGGNTESTDFPITPNAYDTTPNGDFDLFILKLNQTGSNITFSTYIGGSDQDNCMDIEIDNFGNTLLIGYTYSNDFPTTSDAFNKTFNGGLYDSYLLRLNKTGENLEYSTYIGGNEIDHAKGIAVISDEMVYITGHTDSPNFPITPEANDTKHNGGYDIFISKIGLPLNTPPSISDFVSSDTIVFRTNPIYLYSNATDIEDIEKNLTPHFEYRDQNEQVWNNTYFSSPQYQNSRWEVSFTPPKNATLGLYDFRVRYNDTYPSLGYWLYLNDSLTVLNNFPEIENIFLSNNSALLGDSISIWVNATDIEELEENLTIELEYQDPSEVSWDKTSLSTQNYINGRWESFFNIPFNALFGYYDFRARCNDSDGNYSTWLYLNDSLLVYNTGPKVIDIGLSEISIYRAKSVFLYINGTDYETPEDMLSFYVQYKPQSESEWTNLTSNYLNNRYEVSLTTYIDSILGNYDFRVKFLDNESISSGWKYINDSLEVLNNPPMISEELDNISVGIQPLILDLMQYESDIEDTGFNLTWSIDPQIYTYIESIGIIDIVNDTLKITPKENVSGTEDIELTLTDKDSGTAVKSDITIIIDSTVSEFTPKVTLLSPVDKAVINTLTPTLKWELDYSGSDTITYTVAIDENPDPQTTIIAGLTSTEYTLENELIDGKTYYWKVEPTNGICLSGVYRFTIDLGFEPIYKVNLTAETESATIKQGASTDINLTITNEGNSIDNFKLEFSSTNLQSHIGIDKTNVQLDPEVDSKVKLSIDIPDDFTIGDYTITVTATSLTDLTAKDGVTIDVKVVSKDFVPEYDVSISISPTSLELEQGDSENITITISNKGNIEDDFTISFESTDFTSTNIQFSDTSVPIAAEDSDTITVTIKIPDDMEPGVYTIKFIVESNDNPEESILTITVQDGEKPKDGDEDGTMLYAGIGIVVIIIIVVLILLFIFLKKKKEKEEEAPVEEEQPPPPEEVPPEVPPPEQPPTPEVPPEQVPVPETPSPEQPQVQPEQPEVPPEQPPTPEVTPQVPQPQVEPAPESAPVPQVEEQPAPQPQVEPQPQGQAPVPKVVPKIKEPQE